MATTGINFGSMIAQSASSCFLDPDLSRAFSAAANPAAMDDIFSELGKYVESERNMRTKGKLDPNEEESSGYVGMRLKEDEMFVPKLESQDAQACFLMQWPEDAIELSRRRVVPSCPLAHGQTAPHEMANFNAFSNNTTTPNEPYPNTASEMCLFGKLQQHKSSRKTVARSQDELSCNIHDRAVHRHTAA
jgi:hypothetical protein